MLTLRADLCGNQPVKTTSRRWRGAPDTRFPHRYRHHSIIGGKVAFGGIEAGWRDRDARATLRAYASTYEGVGNGTGTTSDLRVRKCGVQEEVDGPFRPTLYISPALDAAEAHHMPPSFTMAPFCQEPRPRAEFE